MCCHGLLTSTSDSRFSSILSSNSQPRILNFAATSSSSSLLQQSSSSRISFRNGKNRLFYKQLSSSIGSNGSYFKPAAATINDRMFVESAEAMAAMSFYELLGISESGTLLDIKQAYKQLARKYHPDVSPPGQCDEYTKKFIRVQEAYETLSDPRRRALYDQDMARNLHFAFSARKRYSDEGTQKGTENRDEWKHGWQSQLSVLKRRSMEKDARTEKDMSWGARMRRQANESSET